MAIAIADLAQLFIVCNMYRVQFYAIAGRLSQEYAKMPPDDERTMDHIRKDLYRVTKYTAELIDHIH